MTTPHAPTPKRVCFQRWYQRFLDWLWFGPLTRDLRPARRPSALRSGCALLADIFRSGWSLILPNPERSRRI